MKPLGKITHNRYVSAVRKELKAWHGIGEDERNRMLGRTMTDSVEFAEEAWLHRNGKTTWRFVPDPKYGELVHVTRSGTVYAILAGHKLGKPFWIGILQDRSWLTCENHLRARSIEFANGGEYVFPKA